MERAMRRGIEHGLPLTQRLVYQAIAFLKYHKTGKCNPAAEQIMLDTGLGRSAVFHAIKALETKGLLIRKSTPNPVHPWKRASNNYHFPNDTSALGGLSLEDSTALQAEETSAPGVENNALGGQTSAPDAERRVHHMHGNKVLEKKDSREAVKKGENPANSKPNSHSFFKSKNQNPKPKAQGPDAVDKLIADAIAKHSPPMESLEERRQRMKQEATVLIAAEQLEVEKARGKAADAERAEYFDESGRPTQKLQAKLRDQGLPEWEIGTESSVPF